MLASPKLSAILAIMLGFAAIPAARASWRGMDIEVVSFVQHAPDHFVLTFDRLAPKQRFVVHLRYNPRRLSRHAHEHYTRARYDEGIALLRHRLSTSKHLTLGLESEKGFLPIPHKPGEYRSEALDVRDGLVIAVPSDLG
jgi:hypothetical protein